MRKPILYRGWVVVVLAAILILSIVGIAAGQGGQLAGQRLTSGPAHNLRPAWSPDGSRIAFFSSRTGNNEIWTMDADGDNQRQLTTDPADDRRPSWSPDGQRIVFDSDRGGTRSLWVMDADGKNLRQLTKGPGEDTFPSYSPDGSQIAFYRYEARQLSLWVMSANAANPKPVVNGMSEQSRNQCTFACHQPAWSPDGRQIAYTVDHTAIWVTRLDGGTPAQLTTGKEHYHFPWWTTDGKILYMAERINERREPINDIWLMDATGKNQVRLFADIPHGGPLEWRPGWKPTGGVIAFHSPRSGNFDIYTTVIGQVEPGAGLPPARPVAPPAAPAGPSAGQATAAPAPKAAEPKAVAQPTTVAKSVEPKPVEPSVSTPASANTALPVLPIVFAVAAICLLVALATASMLVFMVVARRRGTS